MPTRNGITLAVDNRLDDEGKEQAPDQAAFDGYWKFTFFERNTAPSYFSTLGTKCAPIRPRVLYCKRLFGPRYAGKG